MSDQVIWNWRESFNADNLKYGQKDASNGSLRRFECDPDGTWAICETLNGFTAKVLYAPTNYEEYLRYPKWTELNYGKYGSGSRGYKNYYSCDCSQGKMGVRCRHLAALMFKWEEVHGPFIMTETEEARAERLRKEREREKAIQRKKIELEMKKLKQEKVFPVVDYFQARVSPAPEALFFQPDRILEASEFFTNEYEAEIADAFPAACTADAISIDVFCEQGEKQQLAANLNWDSLMVNITISKDKITQLQCNCGRSFLPYYSYWYGDKPRQRVMCGHALALWKRLRERIVREDPGDETDYNGMRFLTLLSGEASEATPAASGMAEGLRRQQSISLIPRITRDRNADSLKLVFDIGRADGKRYAVKGLEALVDKVESESIYSTAKSLSVDFAKETFADSSLAWYQLIQSRVRAVQRVNDRVNRSYYNGFRLSVGAGIPMGESDLDVVYDLAAGGTIQYQYGARNEVCDVRVGEASPRMELRLEPIEAGKKLTGIRLTGEMPRLLQGSQHQYILDKTCFGRIAGEDISFLSRIQGIHSKNGQFTCVIGEKKFAEFYYRVLPSLRRNPQLQIIDNVGSRIESQVPPEPQFTFYLDIGDAITCAVEITYDDVSFPLGQPPEGLSARDIDQEDRVLKTVRQFFPGLDASRRHLVCPLDDDSLVRILTDGVATLSSLGEVKGSDAFKRVHVRPAPQPALSVKVEGGLLELTIRTKDMTEDELLELLASYRLKKRWHRLSSGDYVDLLNAPELDALADTAQAMDLSLEALVKGGVSLPKYRALYVDRLLEAHNELTASRNRLFKQLIRAFQTIKDSDFEASPALMDALRPYQLYGFRWLSTLSQAGFGGILADEMGLGKTLQMLAFIQTQREQGEEGPALVVCPASLVYNWREECRKFTPELSVETIAGTLPQRKAMLRQLTADLYVTSYDLLKRDITLYDGKAFSTVVLDEAQYIKNQRAAVSKAVRVLKAEHRFALTGTPIENRLSELWSIFDFLMPGFLYSSGEFSERFETPIMKRRDPEATAKLSRMTEPFILRRKKTDVLRDLPEKLEETRSSEMEPDQRKLYDAQLVRMRNLLETSGNSGEDKLRILAEITRLRQLCCDPALLFEDYSGSSAKRAACLELIQNAMDAGHRMLVFSQFTSMLALLEADLKAAGIPFFKLTGSTPKLERIRLVNDFNEGDTPVFLISLKAGGTGLNLTGADVVIHYDPWWNLAVQNQATDRAHRIGQTKQVTVIKLIAADTIEEKIIQLQETKRDLAEAIITGQNTSLMSLSREELMELLG